MSKYHLIDSAFGISDFRHVILSCEKLSQLIFIVIFYKTHHFGWTISIYSINYVMVNFYWMKVAKTSGMRSLVVWRLYLSLVNHLWAKYVY